MDDLISRAALLKEIKLQKSYAVEMRQQSYRTGFIISLSMLEGKIAEIPSVDAEPVITGETSDGYHTFNELYHHRAVLFSVIVKAFPERAWKARQHHDGTMYSGMFIVGIDTPEGQASYHYDIDPYWDMFECMELERAPEWDGHTPAQAIERIGKLEPVRHGRWLHTDAYPHRVYCSCCYRTIITNAELMYRYEIPTNFCPNCGAKMSDGGLANENN